MPEAYTYRYPNPRSYALLPVSEQRGNFQRQGRNLRHGYIYGYKDVGGANSTDTIFNATGQDVLGVLGKAAGYRQIDFQNYKMFQFNPPALTMSAQVMTSESPDLGSSEGNLDSPAVGLASSRLELYFDRSEEIAQSNAGAGDAKWRDLGVQIDLFDFFKVISGGDRSVLGTYTEEVRTDLIPEDWGASIRKESMNHFTGQLFDAVKAGSSVFFKSFVVVFNPNLAFHVTKMSGFAFTYLRFTPDLVPTSVKLEIDLEIANMGTKAHAISAGPAGSLGATSTGAGTAPPPDVSGGIAGTGYSSLIQLGI